MLFAMRTVLVLAGLSFGLSACSKINQQNFNQLKAGMDYTQVTQILGEPNSCELTLVVAKSCRWGTEAHKIEVKLIADKVISLSSYGL